MRKYKSEIREVVVYLVIGILTMLITLLVYYLCTDFFLNPNKPIELQAANVISWTFAVIFSYSANRKYTFKSNDKHIVRECGIFVLSRISTLLLDMFLMFVTVTVIGINDRIAKFIVQFVVVVANYLTGKFIVFKKQ